MKGSCGIEEIEFCLPGLEFSAEDVAGWCDASPDFVRNKIGVSSRRFLGPEEDMLDFAVAPARNLLESSNLKADEVGAVVLVTQNWYRGMPHGAAEICHQLGLPKEIASFDVGLGCSGFVYALDILAGFCERQGIQNAIIVCCDPYSRIMRKDDKNTVCIFGDASSATWIRENGRFTIGHGVHYSDGSGADRLCYSKTKEFNGIWSNDAESSDGVHMDGRAIFNFVMREIPEAVSKCLYRNGIASIDDIDYFVFHQASKFMLDCLFAEMDVPEEKVIFFLEEVGNTVSSSVPIALTRLMDRKIPVGSKVLISGFGVGLSWAANILSI